jgi:hypothetical protein
MCGDQCKTRGSFGKRLKSATALSHSANKPLGSSYCGATGSLQWAKSGVGSTTSTSVQQAADGGYLVAGSTANFGAGGSDVLLVKTDAQGNIAGCAAWSTVTPSSGTSFSSTSASFFLSSGTFSTGAPVFTNAAASLTSTSQCQWAAKGAPQRAPFPHRANAQLTLTNPAHALLET